MTATAGSGTRPGSGLPAAARPRRRRPGLVLAVAGLVLVAAVLTGVWVGRAPARRPAPSSPPCSTACWGRWASTCPAASAAPRRRCCCSCGFPASCSPRSSAPGLAIAGAAYQGVFRNPLADPYLLGAAAGAGLGATLAIAYSPVQSLGPVGIVPLAAFVGALVGVGSALALGTLAGGSHSPTLLLAGIAVAAFLAAAQTLVQQQNTDDLREIYGWLLGQLGKAQWSDVVVVLPYLCAACHRPAALRPGPGRARGRGRRGGLPGRAPRPAAAHGHRRRVPRHRRRRRGQRPDRLRRTRRPAHRPPVRRRARTRGCCRSPC